MMRQVISGPGIMDLLMYRTYVMFLKNKFKFKNNTWIDKDHITYLALTLSGVKFNDKSNGSSSKKDGDVCQ